MTTIKRKRTAEKNDYPPKPSDAIDLDVEFSEKAFAKSIGARWDAEGKTWYAPDECVAQKWKDYIGEEDQSIPPPKRAAPAKASVTENKENKSLDQLEADLVDACKNAVGKIVSKWFVTHRKYYAPTGFDSDKSPAAAAHPIAAAAVAAT